MVNNVKDELSEERKSLQAEGLLPDYYTTAAWQMFKSKYAVDGEQAVKGRFETIAKTLAKHTLDAGSFEKIFFDLMWSGKVSPSTPMLANTGTARGMPVSCSGGYVPDSIDGFYSARREMALLSKYGFGTSSYLGDIRQRGSNISIGGKASGILPEIKAFVQTSRDVSQGANRRGAWAGYIPIDHGDFWEVVNYLHKNPDDLNIGWNISDDFISKLEAGDAEAIARFKRSLKVKAETGKGYYFFTDKVNKQNPQMYAKNQLSVLASNLCVTADQRVVSDRGLLTVGELYEQGGNLTLFDNSKVVNSTEMKLIERSADVYKITLNNGLSHKITSYHKVKTDNGMVACKDLSVGDKVYFQNKEGLFGTKNYVDEAFLLGMYQGDGTQSGEYTHINLWEDDFDLIDEIEEKVEKFCIKHKTQFSQKMNRSYPISKFRDCTVAESVTGVKVAKKALVTNAFNKIMDFHKGYIPNWIYESDKETQWSYIRGLFYTDGTVNVCGGSKGNPVYLSITNIDKSFLEELQRLLLNLGVVFSLHSDSNEGYRRLPNGKGGYADYYCNETHRLVCSNKPNVLLFDKHTGFVTRRGVTIEAREYRDNTKKTSKIKSIEYIGKEDVYCVTVNSDDHLWVCNGIVTSNCTEITLYSNDEETYTCVLLSLNASKWDDISDEDIRNAYIMLHCVAKEFIQKADGVAGLEKAVLFTKRNMALGMGLLGWHTLLQEKMIPFESLEAQFLNTSIWKRISAETLKASQWLAGIEGEPENCKGYGVANTHRTAIAPNMSSAILMGGVSQGIEPIVANVFNQGSAVGEIERVNPTLLKLLKERDQYKPKVIQSIIDNKGSVQHLDFLTEHEKLVFKTAFEINQEVILRLASQRQKYICQAQSLNLFFDADEDEGYIAQIHKQAFLDPNIKSLYYMRTLAGVQASKGECIACEG